MARKCYMASVEIEVLFTCDSEDKAVIQKTGEAAVYEEVRMAYMPWRPHCELATYPPSCWDKDTPVYGDHNGEMTAAEAMALNKAEG